MISSETLRRFPIFAELEPAFLEDLSLMCEDRRAEKGEWLFHEGESAEALYLILRGSVELQLKLDKKRNIYAALTTLGEGDVLGWSAMVDPYVYTLGAVASTDTQLVRFDGKNLQKLLEANPDQGYTLMRNIAHAIATRANVLSTRVPDLSWRIIVSTLLSALGTVIGVFIIVFIGAALIGAVGGFRGASQAVPVALFCLIFPAALLIAARFVNPASSQGTTLTTGQNDSTPAVS